MSQQAFDAVIFDLGGVLLGWDPTLAYVPVLPAEEITPFLDKIDFPAWNRAHDGGQPFAVGEAELLQRFPDDVAAILAYREHFPRTLTGMVPGTSMVVAELQQAGVDLVGLTNWSAETFPYAQQRFGILQRLRGILVSGAENLAKPDPEIFRRTCDRFGLDPARSVFVDDAEANVAAAGAVGLTAVRFTDAEQLRADLVRLGVLDPRTAVDATVRHLAVRADWEPTRTGGSYPFSTRGVDYDREGYVHCSFDHQVQGVRKRYYADLADDDLVLLRLRPGAPIVPEDLGPGEPFPHLYAPLTPDLVLAEEPFVTATS